VIRQINPKIFKNTLVNYKFQHIKFKDRIIIIVTRILFRELYFEPIKLSIHNTDL
jgi:hypothetical protein